MIEKRAKKRILAVLMAFFALFVLALAPAGRVYASGECDTAILPQAWCVEDDTGGEGLKAMVTWVGRTMFTGAMIVGTIGVVIVGIMYVTARENENQVAMAKKRLVQIVIGMLFFILMGVILQLFGIENWDAITQ